MQVEQSTIAIDIGRACCIPGWMTNPELEWLAETATTHSNIVELGSFRGRSTRALADHTSGTVYAIDTWCTLPFLFLSEDSQKQVWAEFQHNLADHITTEKVRVFRCAHEDSGKLSLPAPDMVFIDGSHDYDSVIRDISIWWEKLAPGGILCGHDACNSDWPDVDKAVDELLPAASRVPRTMLWWIRKEESPVLQLGTTALGGLTALRDISTLQSVGNFIVDSAAEIDPHTPAKEIPVGKWEPIAGMLATTPEVCIAVPSSGRYVPPEMFLATALLQYPPATPYAWIATKGQRRDQARCDLCKQARELGARYLLFVDDDNPPPPDTLMKLLHAMENADEDVAVVAGIYTSKSSPAYPLVFGDDGKVMWKWKRGDVFECGRIATGCMLIRLSALDHLEEPWFLDIKTRSEVEAYWQHAQGYAMGDRNYCFEVTDDMYFCWKLKKAGYRILAHGGVLPGHWDADGNCYRLAEDSYPMRG